MGRSHLENPQFQLLDSLVQRHGEGHMSPIQLQVFRGFKATGNMRETSRRFLPDRYENTAAWEVLYGPRKGGRYYTGGLLAKYLEIDQKAKEMIEKAKGQRDSKREP